MDLPMLKTPRLLLRPFAPEDLPALFELLRDEEVNRFLPWFPVKTPDETRLFYRQRFARFAWALCLKEDNVPIGYISVGEEAPYDFGYALSRAHWGRGLMTEAARAAVGELERLGLPYLTATHDRNNPQSGRVMQKTGMIYRYSYEEQWQPKDFPVIFRMYQRNFTADGNFVYTGYQDEHPHHFVERI